MGSFNSCVAPAEARGYADTMKSKRRLSWLVCPLLLLGLSAPGCYLTKAIVPDETTADESAGARFGRVLLLPFAVVADVATFPFQILIWIADVPVPMGRRDK